MSKLTTWLPIAVLFACLALIGSTAFTQDSFYPWPFQQVKQDHRTSMAMGIANMKSKESVILNVSSEQPSPGLSFAEDSREVFRITSKGVVVRQSDGDYYFVSLDDLAQLGTRIPKQDPQSSNWNINFRISDGKIRIDRDGKQLEGEALEEFLTNLNDPNFLMMLEKKYPPKSELRSQTGEE